MGVTIKVLEMPLEAEPPKRSGPNRKSNGKSGWKKIRRVSNVLNALCIKSILDFQVETLTVRQLEICGHIEDMVRQLDSQEEEDSNRRDE